MDSLDDQLAHFNSISWCSKLLSDPNLIIRPLVSRAYSHKGHAFEYCAKTLNTPTTIPFFLAFMHPPTSQVEATDNVYDAPTGDSDKQSLESRFATKVYFLLTLGHGLTTFREGFCHGGVVATILDECNGAVGVANKMFGLMKPLMHVTHSMSVTYLRPVPVDTTVLVTATLTKVDGDKKFVVEGEMSDESGRVLVKSEVNYVVLDRQMEAFGSHVKGKF